MITALVVIVVLLGAAWAFVASRPNTFRIERATTIKAPPEKIFPLINDLHGFNTWNPVAKVDPDMKLSYSGPQAGRGAAYAWESRKMGVGSMEIVDTAPPSKVVLKLDFVKPFAGSNVVEFTLQPKGDSTDVTWEMRGPMAFIPKIMNLFVSTDKMVGGQFETGLADMKAVAER